VRGISDASADIVTSFLSGQRMREEIRIDGSREKKLDRDCFLKVVNAIRDGSRSIKRIDVRFVNFAEVVNQLVELMIGNRAIREFEIKDCE
jgi:hypothetical protein